MSENFSKLNAKHYLHRLRHRFIKWTCQYNIAGDISDLENFCDKDVLFENERAHIQRFLSPNRINESLNGISMIKKLVGNMCASSPTQIQLLWDSSGAPKVLCHNSKTGEKHIPVSISHSTGMVTGICMNPVDSDVRYRPQIGIDIEKISSEIPTSIIEMFSEQEQAYISMLPDWQKSLVFTKLWTRKEALFKSSNFAFGDIISWNAIPNQIISGNTFEFFQLDTLYLAEIDIVTSIAIRRNKQVLSQKFENH
ncbi:4'-phosphopantetheinyl transferase superfamily protein [candidate division KSB1 bacterium]|nr:4'-phosphopantetheinyl transferase superfamily protein [candidate division KSB1 bacterium]